MFSTGIAISSALKNEEGGGGGGFSVGSCITKAGSLNTRFVPLHWWSLSCAGHTKGTFSLIWLMDGNMRAFDCGQSGGFSSD